eukprot:1283516-Rhodomonas_salina.1
MLKVFHESEIIIECAAGYRAVPLADIVDMSGASALASNAVLNHTQVGALRLSASCDAPQNFTARCDHCAFTQAS